MKIFGKNAIEEFGLSRRAWNFYAHFYDIAQPRMIKFISAFGDLSYEEFEKEFIRLAHLKRGQTVLDVACGTGASHAALSHCLGPKGEIVAVDISPRMLKRARSRAGRLKIQNINYEEADAERLSLHFDEEIFDTVLCCNGLPNFLHPKRAFVEMAYVLRPGGTLAVSTISRERCDENPFWRWTLRYPAGRFPYQDAYRAVLEEMEFDRITFHACGLMLVITARKGKSKKPGTGRTKT